MPTPTPRCLPNRHPFGLTTPTPTGIALAMERRLTVRWCYQCLSPYRDTPKLVLCGKAHQQDPRRPRCRLHHTRAKYLPRHDRRVVLLLCRQVDDIAVACSDPTVVQGLIDSIGKVMDLKSQGILGSFNGIDVDQRREYVKVSCQSYLARMLKTHGWY
jgi:hypothetical protein